MRKLIFIPMKIIIAIFILTGCNGGNGSSGGGITYDTFIHADYTRVDASSISLSDLNAARALNMSLDHASVGGNIKGGMDALVTDSSTRYSYGNWDWRGRGNPGWQAKVDQFISWVTNHNSEYDVFQMKFCYIDGGANFTYYRDKMLQLESAYPTKHFIWWTIPLYEDGSSNNNHTTFNNQIRNYCSTHNKPLYDIADIESHDASGTHVVTGGNESLAHAWSEDGGHPNAAGSKRLAQAMWWIMIEIAKY